MNRTFALALLAIASFAGLTIRAAGKPVDSEPFTIAFNVTIEKPGAMAFDGKRLWVADRIASKLRGLDPTTGRELVSLAAPGPWPAGLAFDGKLLWVVDTKRERLFGIDLDQRLVVREMQSPPKPEGLAYDGEHLWVADGTKLHRITREDGTELVTWSAPAFTGEGKPTEQLGLAFFDGTLWVTDRHRDLIYRVDPSSGMVVDSLPSPGPMPAGIALDSKGRLLVVDVDRRAVSALAMSALPLLVQNNPKPERVRLVRRVTNGGPGTLVEAHIYLALPVDLPGQEIVGKLAFSPQPTEFLTDQWGQRFAHFRALKLAPCGVFEASMTVDATLYDVRRHLDPAKVGPLSAIPADIKKQYLVDATKFAITSPSIRKHVEAALGGEKRPYWMARKIAKYIQDRMRYELAGGWNIAPTVIDRGTGSCSEYTFVFISMCRAAGLPARYVGALVVRGDDASTDEVFHRWPEVYLPGYGFVTFDVQAGDKPAPEAQAEVIGRLPNRFLVTTIGGGASSIIGWEYDSYTTWVCDGRCDVLDEPFADWFPRR